MLRRRHDTTSSSSAAPSRPTSAQPGSVVRELPATLLAKLLDPRVLGTIAFRYVCYLLMLAMTLAVEARPAPSLPDALLGHVPYVPWVARYNYLVWSLAYLPLAVALLVRDTTRFRRYMVSAGLLALLRGVCIAATGLGPVRGADVNAGLSSAAQWQAFVDIVLLRGVLTANSPAVYLTKDLFFSGHTATTFLLLLYVWRERWLRWPALFAHVVVVLTVFFAHLHYTIDVLGAYAFTFALFAWREGRRT